MKLENMQVKDLKEGMIVVNTVGCIWRFRKLKTDAMACRYPGYYRAETDAVDDPVNTHGRNTVQVLIEE